MAFKKSESDDEFIIQIEVVGFASQTHTWPDSYYRNFAEDVVVPLTAIGVPMQHLRFYGADEGIVLASPKSPIRLTDSQLRAYSGWMGHQHAPDPDAHWDPGRFLMDKAFEYAAKPQTMGEEVITVITCASPNKCGLLLPDGRTVDVTDDKTSRSHAQALINAGKYLEQKVEINTWNKLVPAEEV